MPKVPNPPPLSSMVLDKNDKTQEEGFWTNKSDAKSLYKFEGNLYNVIKELEEIIKAKEKVEK